MDKQKYQVIVGDNFHFMDKSEDYKDGEYDTYEEAVTKCKEIVDSFLVADDVHRLTAEQLYHSWQMYGENPWIVGENVGNFSSTQYAKERSSALTKR